MIYYKKKIQQDVGATAVEYGILSALIAVVTILALQATGTSLGTTYCTVANQLSQAVGAGSTASGCSATSSSSSSSSSADSSGSSADSSGSGSSGSSDSSSDSSASASTSATYDASNSYTISDPDQELGNFENMFSQYAQDNIQSMTGIYDSNGNPITTPQEYAKVLGISDDTYQKISDIRKNINPSTGSIYSTSTAGQQLRSQAGTEAYNEALAEINSSGQSVYIPSLSDATFTSDGGYTFTYDKPQPGYTGAIQDQIWRSAAGTIGQDLISPTGD